MRQGAGVEQVSLSIIIQEERGVEKPGPVTFAKCTFNMDIDPKCIKNVSTKSCTYKYCPIVFGDITTAQ